MNIRPYLVFLALSFAACSSCTKPGSKTDPDPEPEPAPVVKEYAKGADLGWLTEMEAKNFKFYNASGQERECTALMKELGCNAIRIRVWVDPASGPAGNGYCAKADVLEKAKRAKSLGMDVMIDFHYSDWWADPGKQILPKAWENMNQVQISDALAAHTKDVLSALKAEGVPVKWVQVGNEVTNGMLCHKGYDKMTDAPAAISGKVAGSSCQNFVKYFNSGAAAVKAVYPEALVILHIDNAWKTETLNWFFKLVTDNGAKYDMMGLSLYPSYWEAGGYPAWETKVKQAVNNFRTLNSSFAKPIMLVEFGMPASEPQKSKDALQYVIANTKDKDYFKGVFLWEPESEKSRNGYDYGAFKDGKPTVAMDSFKN